ncbi:MAG: hypothetical protein VW582_09245, partial [Rhodospirillaceae bacterium]
TTGRPPMIHASIVKPRNRLSSLKGLMEDWPRNGAAECLEWGHFMPGRHDTTFRNPHAELVEA